MNLRQFQKQSKPVYTYFINYGFYNPDKSNGEGFCALDRDQPIESYADLMEIVDTIKSSLKDEKSVEPEEIIIRNFILLKTKGVIDGTEPRETESSPEDDQQVSEGPQR